MNDRRVVEGARQKFTSAILPPYVRRSPRVESVLPLLYLHGLSTGDFREALPALLGADAAGLSPSAITRLTHAWATEYAVFGGGISGTETTCMCGPMGSTSGSAWRSGCARWFSSAPGPMGRKRSSRLEDGYRESAESWGTLLRDLKARGLRAPAVAVGDGALGFWAAVREVWPETTEQRCWVHRLANVLDKLPKGLQPRAKRALHEIMNAETRAAAERDIARFTQEFGAKHPKAVAALTGRPSAAAGVLRLPGGALDASAHDEPDRVDVRHGAVARRRDQGGGLPHGGPGDRVQAAAGGAGALAPPQRGHAPPARARGHHLQR